MANHVNAALGIENIVLHKGACRLRGFSYRESAQVAVDATFILRDGLDVTGDPVAFVEVPANRSDIKTFPDGIECKVGLFLERVAGATEVVVYI